MWLKTSIFIVPEPLRQKRKAEDGDPNPPLTGWLPSFRVYPRAQRIDVTDCSARFMRGFPRWRSGRLGICLWEQSYSIRPAQEVRAGQVSDGLVRPRRRDPGRPDDVLRSGEGGDSRPANWRRAG